MAENQHEVLHQNIAVKGSFDVLVVGGGFSGVCAAVAASRAGAGAAIIERDGMLGGQAAEVYTMGLDGFIDRNGKHYARGIPWEVLQKTVAEGQSDPMWSMADFETIANEGLEKGLQEFGVDSKHLANCTYINPNAFRFILSRLVNEAGVALFLEAPLTGVLMDGTRIEGIVAAGNYGHFGLRGKVVVDTTPHAGVAALAGRPFPYPEAYTGSHPRVAAVDVDQLIQYVAENPDDVEVSLVASPSADILRNLVQQGIPLLMNGFRKPRERAIADDPIYEAIGRGDPPKLCSFFYDRDGCGTYWVHAAEHRYTRLDDPLTSSKTIDHMRAQQWLTHKLFRDYVPGFRHAHLMDAHPHIARALLMSREPSGFTEYDIPWDHIEKGDNRYEDSIARVMGHPNKGQAPNGFQVPYRSLIPKGLEGIIVTGKPACRSFHYHGTTAVLGQAAGVAGAVAAQEGVPLRLLDVSNVQEELARQDAVVF